MQTIKGIRVTDSQADVYSVLKSYGPLPDHVLVPIVQHAVKSHQSSSGIRTRRAELRSAGLIRPIKKTVKTGSGRTAQMFTTR